MVIVTVVIPCYNSQNTILRALNSIVRQTYKDVEIIIIDDGSTDNTQVLIQQFFENKTIQYQYIYQSNAGPSSARNKGVQNAQGDYIAFLDSDDEWHKDKLKLQMEVIQNKNLNFLGSRYQYDVFDYEQKQTIKLESYCFNSLLLKTRFSTPGVVMKKDFFLFLNGFNESLKYAEDHDLWLRASLKNDLYLIEEPKLVRLHKNAFGETGLSSHMFQMFLGELSVVKKLYKNQSISSVKYLSIKVFLFIKFIRRYFYKILK